MANIEKDHVNKNLNMLLGLTLLWLIICGVAATFIFSNDFFKVPQNTIKFVKDSLPFLLISATFVFCIMALNRIASNIRDLRRTSGSLVQRNAQLKSKNTLLEDDNKKLKDLNAELMGKIEKQNMGNATTRAELEDRKKELVDYAAKRETLMHNNKALIKEIDELKAERTNREDKERALLEQIRKLKGPDEETQQFYLSDQTEKDHPAAD
ncbi:MAG: hypothetical protein ABH875_06210 [Candidatus Omnitrophota bacterium]